MNEIRKLATIIFADIKGYTQLMQTDEDKGLQLIRSFRKTIEAITPASQGRIVQYFGDGCLLSFDSASKAARASILLQKEFIANNIPVRMGMHIGDVVFREGNVFGDGVNIASRIESFGVPGSVLISKHVRDHIKSKKEFRLVSVSKVEFKNVDEKIEIFALANEGLVVPQKKSLRGKGKVINKPVQSGILVASIAILLLTSLIIFMINRSGDTPKIAENLPEEDNLSIAVLPLLNLNSKDENLEYFSDGVTQEIIDELSQVKALTMIAFTSTIRYKGSNLLNNSIATELNARYLISGTSRIFSGGDSIKISLELINPSENDKRIWNSTYTELMQDAPSIQNKIAKQVANSLNLELTSEEVSLLDQSNTTNGEAYRMFLLARSEFFKLNREGFRRSIQILQDVVDLDQDFAQAYTFLAWAYQLASNPWFDGHINEPIKELNEFVSPIIKKSIALDASNSDIYLVRGHQSAFLNGQLKQARQDVDYALELNSWPIVPTTYCMCVVVSTYVALDDTEPAADLIEMARKLDPGSVFLEWDAANVYMKRGQFKKAQELYEDAAKTLPVSMFKSFLGWNYYHNKEYDRAREQLLRTYKESDRPITLNVAYLSSAYFRLGDLKESDRYLNELLQRSKSGEHHVNLYIAAAYLEREEKSKAIDYLEKAWDLRNWGMALFINLDPSFQKLRSEPRFREIRKQMGIDSKEAELTI